MHYTYKFAASFIEPPRMTLGNSKPKNSDTLWLFLH